MFFGRQEEQQSIMGSEHVLRVMIVDDHAAMRIGLSTFLAAFTDLCLVGEASNGEEAVQLCEQLHPDVILMDLIMPIMDGVSAIQIIRQQFPSVQVIAVTSFEEADLVKGALQAGAMGYLLKDVSADKLAEAIREAVRGRPILSPEATRLLIEASTRSGVQHRYQLSDREKDVLRLIVDGLSNAQIAERLVVSPSTVKTHVSTILSKLGANSRAEAVAMALQQHLLS